MVGRVTEDKRPGKTSIARPYSVNDAAADIRIAQDHIDASISLANPFQNERLPRLLGENFGSLLYDRIVATISPRYGKLHPVIETILQNMISAPR